MFFLRIFLYFLICFFFLDCGLSFPSLEEVVQHRKEFHPAPVVKEDVHLPVSENIVDSTSGDGKHGGKKTRSAMNKKTSEQVVSTGLTTRSQRRQQIAESKKSVGNDFSEGKQNIEDPNKDSSSRSVKAKDKVKKLEEPEQTNPKKNLCNRDKRRKSSDTVEEDESNEDDVVSTKKLDKKKVRLVHLAQEDVRVKAEAALRELNIPKRAKTQPAPNKWGVETLKFTKQNSNDVFVNATAAMARAKFATLIENKWKIPSSSTSLSDANTKVDPLCQSNNDPGKCSDVYDFNDDELCLKKKSLHFGQQHFDGKDDIDRLSQSKKELHSQLDS